MGSLKSGTQELSKSSDVTNDSAENKETIQMEPVGRRFPLSLKLRINGICAVTVGFVITLFIYLAVNAINVSTVYHMENGYARLSAFELKQNWVNYTAQKDLVMLQMQSNPGAEPDQNAVKKMAHHLEQIDKLFEANPQKDFLPEQVVLFEQVDKDWNIVKTPALQAQSLLGNKEMSREEIAEKFGNILNTEFDRQSRAFMDATAALQQTVTDAQQKAYDERVAARDFYVLGVVILTVLGILLLAIASVVISRPVVKAAMVTSASFSALSTGDLTASFKQVSNDEIGTMAPRFNKAVSKLRAMAAISRQIVVGLTKSAITLSKDSDEITKRASQISTQASQVAQSAQKVANTMEEVSAGTQELAKSIENIADNAQKAAKVAKEATDVAEQTTVTVSKLGESSQSIGTVINTITEVAEQTNLLALNATIEAARVGEAGRGFAVVASEIKDLALETGRATEEIADRIEAIQTNTIESVEEIAEISKVVSSINDHQKTIASAVEEQNATTTQMYESVENATQGAVEIAEQIESIAQSSNSSAQSLNEISTHMDQVADRAEELEKELSQFRY